MQAGRTTHYAWLYRGGSQRSQARSWPNESTPRPPLAGAELSLGAAPDARVAPKPRRPGRADLAGTSRGARGGDSSWEADPSLAATAAAARTHFLDAQIRAAVQAGIKQMVWLGPRSGGSGRTRGSAEVEVFQLDQSSPRTGRQPGVRAQLDRALVRSARTLFVCDGLLDPIEPATIRAILRTIGESCYGSRLACVYTDGELISGSAPFGASQKSRPAVPKLGEPSAPGLDARSLPARLACAGLVLDADVSVTEYARRWLGEGRGDLRGYSFCRLATAHVRAPSPDNQVEVGHKSEE